MVEQGEQPLSPRAFAGQMHIPEASLEAVLQQLRRAGITRSVRGGGYLLAQPAASLRVGEILRALRGDISIFTAAAEAPETPAQASAVQEFWDYLQGTMNGVVDGLSLQDLANRQETLAREQAPRE